MARAAVPTKTILGIVPDVSSNVSVPAGAAYPTGRVFDGIGYSIGGMV